MQQIFSQKIHFKDDDGNAFPEWNTHELAMLSESGIFSMEVLMTLKR